jgi:hypothetical protein
MRCLASCRGNAGNTRRLQDAGADAAYGLEQLGLFWYHRH